MDPDSVLKESRTLVSRAIQFYSNQRRRNHVSAETPSLSFSIHACDVCEFSIIQHKFKWKKRNGNQNVQLANKDL